MTDQMHISSLVIHVRPDSMAAIQHYIESEGGEVPASDHMGKLVVVLETETDSAVTEFANTIALMDGVLSANLVFHHFDSFEQTAADPMSVHATGGHS